jgi:hypothetical protein
MTSTTFRVGQIAPIYPGDPPLLRKALSIVAVVPSRVVTQRRSAAPPEARSRRPSIAFLTLAGLVIGGSVVVRLILLGRQSYWIDELFSANESAGSVHHLLKVGSTEVHTPFYAALLWAWIRIGGSHEVWTRLLSTIFVVTAVLVTERGLRPIRLSDYVRWALTVATAAGGTSMIYSIETRSYALLLLGSVGLTVTLLRVGVLILDGEAVSRWSRLSWLGWVGLAATAHLFGAVLAFGGLVVIAVLTLTRGERRVRRTLEWVLLTAIGCALQGAWLADGLGRPDFASGTDWIMAPRAHDVWVLLTTTFGAGTMTPQKDGFAWTSPIGVLAVIVLILGATGAGYLVRSRRPRSITEPTGRPDRPAPETKITAEAQVAAILLGLTGFVIVFALVSSQFVHLWTLRNLIIVVPALTWGVICLAAAATRTEGGRQWVSTAAVVLLGLSLVPTTIGLTHPYKTDFRGLMDYLIAERAQQPDVQFAFLGHDPPWDWHTASDRPADDPAWTTLYSKVTLSWRAASYPKKLKPGAVRPPGTEIVVYYHGVAYPHLARETTLLLRRLGGVKTCTPVPIYDVIVVKCQRPS